MTDPLLEPGQALDRLAAWKGRIDGMAADTQGMSERMTALRVTAADETRTVEVTVDAQGVLLDLKLGRRTQQLAPDELARTIMQTVQKARRRAVDQVRQVLDETIGADSAVGRAIVAQSHRSDGEVS